VATTRQSESTQIVSRSRTRNPSGATIHDDDDDPDLTAGAGMRRVGRNRRESIRSRATKRVCGRRNRARVYRSPAGRTPDADAGTRHVPAGCWLHRLDAGYRMPMPDGCRNGADTPDTVRRMAGMSWSIPDEWIPGRKFTYRPTMVLPRPADFNAGRIRCRTTNGPFYLVLFLFLFHLIYLILSYSYLILFYSLFLSYLILFLSYLILILSWPYLALILFHLILSYSILFLSLFYLILFYLILSILFYSYLILSYLILSYLVLSYLILILILSYSYSLFYSILLFYLIPLFILLFYDIYYFIMTFIIIIMT
jgi:hypothetical protein